MLVQLARVFTVIFGFIFALEASLVAFAFGLPLTVITLCIAIVFGFPAHMFTSLGGSSPRKVEEWINDFGLGPIKWASDVAGNLFKRLAGILSGETPSSRKGVPDQHNYGRSSTGVPQAPVIRGRVVASTRRYESQRTGRGQTDRMKAEKVEGSANALLAIVIILDIGGLIFQFVPHRYV